MRLPIIRKHIAVGFRLLGTKNKQMFLVARRYKIFLIHVVYARVCVYLICKDYLYANLVLPCRAYMFDHMLSVSFSAFIVLKAAFCVSSDIFAVRYI